ncbi:MAG: radical SAM family heme chaperone HemW [Tannerella sp.]|nr:radical SAM family heme chaperone HemW [Tannerella sp.]
MAGLYIHVPFCTRRCTYCDFFSQTEMNRKPSYIQAVVNELMQRKEYVGGESVETIYFGGGTPSLLQTADFEAIFDAIRSHYDVLHDAEVTLEANPDDITPAYLATLRAFPFNRISLGVQSFDDGELRMLNRRHNSRQAIEAIEHCRDKGFVNLSIDLIYGLPGQAEAQWENNLLEAVRLDVPHLSAYHLTIEKGTQIYRQAEAGTISPVDEETSERFFYTLINVLTQAGYLHYEISNFCKPDCFSRHNSAYWVGRKYIGVGPSAHSYDLHSRQWNVASLADYIDGYLHRSPVVEKETLTEKERYNEYVITRLRTMWGIPLSDLRETFGKEQSDYFIRRAKPYLRRKLLRETAGTVRILPEGWFISDAILRELIV